jgi:urocanate hydratase
MLGRDHHDVSGTDSPYRETSNIKDGSHLWLIWQFNVLQEMAARGMSMIALHNGGGVGIGKAINGGFGLVLDGSYRVDKILEIAMLWDVMGGVARRSWARNPASIETVKEYNKIMEGKDEITLPYLADNELIKGIVEESYGKNN